MNEVCYTDPTKTYLHTIIDWSDTDVWEFLKSNNIPYCKLYKEGYSRLGCVLCPLKSQRERVKDLNRYPRIADAYKRAIIRAYDSRERPSKGITSGEDMFNWWISGRSAWEWAKKDTSFWAYE